MSKLRKLTELDVMAFDFSSMGPNSLRLFSAKRGAGKSTWASYTSQISQHARVGRFIVLAGSEKVKAYWGKIVNPMFVRDPSLELLRQIKKEQNDLIAKYIKKGKPFPPELHLSIILDDVAGDPSFIKSKELIDFCANGRHWECDITICLQYLKMVPPQIRQNIDYIFVLSTANQNMIKMLVEEFVSCCSIGVLTEIMRVVTKDFGALVINNCNNGAEVLDTCFHARVPIEYLGDTTPLGGPHFLKYAAKYYKDPNRQEINQVNTEMDSSNGDEDDNDSSNKSIQEHTFEDRYGRVIIRCLPKGELYKCKKD